MVRENRKRNLDHYQAYERKRRPPKHGFQPPPKLTAEERAAHIKARTAVGNAIRDGRLVKGCCEVCGSAKQVEAHHDDYTKPLAVRWFCREHHYGDAHRKD